MFFYYLKIWTSMTNICLLITPLIMSPCYSLFTFPLSYINILSVLNMGSLLKDPLRNIPLRKSHLSMYPFVIALS